MKIRVRTKAPPIKHDETQWHRFYPIWPRKVVSDWDWPYWVFLEPLERRLDVYGMGDTPFYEYRFPQTEGS
jgi:hypothetical protein